LEKLKELSAKDLNEAKTFIEGDYLLEIEDPQKVADQIVFWEQAGTAKMINEYVKNIKKVTLKDVQRIMNKYFKYYTFVIVEGK